MHNMPASAAVPHVHSAKSAQPAFVLSPIPFLTPADTYHVNVGETEVASEISLQRKIELAWQSLAESQENCGTAADLMRLFSAISGEAEKLNRPDVATAVHALKEELRSSEMPPPEFFERCRSELDRLRTATAATPAPEIDLATDPELLDDFILESQDYLASVETNLLSIERNPEDSESIHSVFRSFHTIKGLAGFLGFPPIQQVAHEIENVLDHVREGKLPMTSTIIDTVLRAADYLKDCIGLLSEFGAAVRSSADFPPNRDLLTAIRQAETQQLVPAADLSEKAESAEPAKTRSSGTTSTVKVDTSKMEYLVDMIGELVIAQSIVRHDPVLVTGDNPTLSRNLAQLARVTEEVQKTAMSMRMVPIGRLFGKMERLVRDLGRKSGKQIEFQTAGEHAELDRNIVEELADPMVHMIRNSVDHGLESPQDRISRGKPPVGKIKIEAHHEAGCIIIRLSDDGRGMDRERILAKAKERGLVAANARLSDDEILRLIFQPGFSTAEKVTDISGRGVGMDVVSRHIQKLRGRIEIKSVLGEGCTFTLRLPLTLAIIDGLVVSVAEERFIVPIFAMREMFCSTEETRFTIEGKNEMVLFRGALLPVVRLRERFSIQGTAADNLILIVIQGRDREFCLAVDQLIGKYEVVIKSLGTCFRDVPGVAGGAILGDGKVGLILDVDSLCGAAQEWTGSE
ncbi:MAG: cheA [Bryobacterales bacterium]|nr:cheA [Bryobacterales bacterium]